ncbi:hypothetical protein NLI96_g6295 [Meripilus lineatus]|uniref:Uncharacterized protein n=1 Tax=Meripilus lineatus TaxID=2056292 RepID=A0AAD5YE14_9APHY|nr:hypothetical protein NLI96_g6295 [Physisporinus lineatus]
MQRPGSSLASTFNRVSISSDATYTPNLDAAVDSAFRRAQLYETQIRQLEQTLTGDLHTSKEVDAELTRVQHGLHPPHPSPISAPAIHFFSSPTHPSSNLKTSFRPFRNP